jgi:single-strand DNA-binding protein
MLNKIILIGNLGRDPEIQTTQDGRKIAKFSLATSPSWKARPRENAETNDEYDQADWHRVVVFRDTTVRWIQDILKRGDTVYVEGRLTYYKWQDPQGHTHRISNIAVSGQHGRVQHLRSKKPIDLSSITQRIYENLELDNISEENSDEYFDEHYQNFQQQGESFDE